MSASAKPPKSKMSKIRFSDLLYNDFVSEDMLLEALNPKRRPYTREMAARHPSATPAVIMKALKDGDSLVVEAALENKNIDEDLLAQIIQPLMDGLPHWSGDDHEKSTLVERMDRNHKITLIQTALLNPCASPRIIADALFHHAEEIRSSAARHPNLNNPVFVLSVKAKMCG